MPETPRTAPPLLVRALAVGFALAAGCIVIVREHRRAQPQPEPSVAAPEGAASATDEPYLMGTKSAQGALLLPAEGENPEAPQEVYLGTSKSLAPFELGGEGGGVVPEEAPVPATFFPSSKSAAPVVVLPLAPPMIEGAPYLRSSKSGAFPLVAPLVPEPLPEAEVERPAEEPAPADDPSDAAAPEDDAP